jgi:diguanylate cyclase (GGDEF)-like protein
MLPEEHSLTDRTPKDSSAAATDSIPQALKHPLKASLADFYRLLACFASEIAKSNRPEIGAAASLLAQAEAMDRALDALFSPGRESAHGPAENSPQPRRPRVLVVDDDLETCGGLAELLGSSYEVIVAHDGIEGGRLARERRPDVVVTDLCMPEVDGYALLSAVRHGDETAHIPLLVLSSLRQTEAKVRAFEAGAFDYLTKPVAPGEVLARLRNAIAHSNDLREQRHLQQTDDLTGLVNRRFLRTFLATAAQQAKERHSALTVVCLDQDNLKAINDTHGHAAGDSAIRTIADALQGCKRASDCAARVGGDEFVVVMPGTDRAGAEVFIGRVQDGLAKNPLRLPDNATVVVSASFGIASLNERDWEESADQILERADAQLIETKGESRRRRAAPADG